MGNPIHKKMAFILVYWVYYLWYIGSIVLQRFICKLMWASSDKNTWHYISICVKTLYLLYCSDVLFIHSCDTDTCTFELMMICKRPLTLVFRWIEHGVLAFTVQCLWFYGISSMYTCRWFCIYIAFNLRDNAIQMMGYSYCTALWHTCTWVTAKMAQLNNIVGFGSNEPDLSMWLSTRHLKDHCLKSTFYQHIHHSHVQLPGKDIQT